MNFASTPVAMAATTTNNANLAGLFTLSTASAAAVSVAHHSSSNSSGSVNSSLFISNKLNQLKDSFSKSMVAGGIAGAVAKTSIAPFERMKIIFQISTNEFSLKQVKNEMVHIVRHEGVTSLWRGHTASLIRVIPYSSIQLSAHDVVKRFFQNQTNEKELKPHLRVLSGSIAGGVSVMCTYPLDLLRARLAVDKNIQSTLVDGNKTMRIGKLGNCVVNVVKTHGVAGLFKGLTPTMLGILPYSGLAFGSFETLKIVLAKQDPSSSSKDISTTMKMVCGALSGFVAQSATYPIDVIRRRMQTDGLINSQDVRYNSMTQTAKHIFKTEGMKGFFKGVTLNWIKGPIAVGVSFATFDLLKDLLSVSNEEINKKKSHH